MGAVGESVSASQPIAPCCYDRLLRLDGDPDTIGAIGAISLQCFWSLVLLTAIDGSVLAICRFRLELTETL